MGYGRCGALLIHGDGETRERTSMTDDPQAEKSLSDLLDEYNTLSSQADELRRQMKVLSKQIEDRADRHPHLGRSSGKIDIPNEALPPA
jgi:hypothetical protein